MADEVILLNTNLRKEYYGKKIYEEIYDSLASLLANASFNSNLFVRIIGHRECENGKYAAAILDDNLDTLKNWLSKHPVFTQNLDLTEDVKKILFGIMSAISYLQGRGIYIEPLAEENVVVDRHHSPKLRNLKVITDARRLKAMMDDDDDYDKFGILKVLGLLDRKRNLPSSAKMEELSHFSRIFSLNPSNRTMKYVDNPFIWPEHIRLIYRAMGYDNISFICGEAMDRLKDLNKSGWVKEAKKKGCSFFETFSKGYYTDNCWDFLRYCRAMVYHADNSEGTIIKSRTMIRYVCRHWVMARSHWRTTWDPCFYLLCICHMVEVGVLLTLSVHVP